ncbi:MAG: ABC transporter substrate-binding protein [Clostridia bacterium]|nr:ABC transporter substrate-binding protein [Clostridia bacterium]
MRNSWFKYLFILFAIGIIVFAVVKIKGDEENKKQEQLAKENRQEEKIKEITLGVAEFDSINPILSRNLNVQNISKLIFEPLINLNNSFKPEPALAIEWAKQDATSYLIKLRENVKWSDGNDFTAEDVRFTIDRLKRDTPSIYGNNVQFIERVDVVDNLTLKITLAKEIPFFEYYLTFPIMSSKYFTEADFANAEKNVKPIGTGKYKVTDVQPSVITLEKNENWWNSNKIGLSLEKIYINLYSSVGELYNSFKTGNIDLLATNNNSFSDYIGTIGYNLKEIRSREHVFLALNTQSEYLQDVNVRKAIAGFIDKSNITTNIYGAKYYTTSFPLEYGSYLYKGSTPGIDYNIENAQNLLNGSRLGA